MNKPLFEKYNHFTKKQKNDLSGELVDMIVYSGSKNTFHLPIKRAESFEVLFTYLNPSDTSTIGIQENYVYDFFDGFNELIKKDSYNNVLERITDSIDIFGLGITLQYIIICFKKIGGLKTETFNRVSTFFKKMHDFNPVNRVIDIDALIDEYEGLLSDIGVLTRLNKRFNNHKPVKGVATNKKTKNKPVVIEDNKTFEIVVNCPPEKEINPNTTRCVKKCKKRRV
jgi:hypothetical protein